MSDPVSREQVELFMDALRELGIDRNARLPILNAAREAFELSFPACGAAYRPSELAFPPVCALPLGHDGEFHDNAPDSTFSDRWMNLGFIL